MNRPVAQWPQSCPQCGSDMEQEKPCQVCGYTPAVSRSTAGAQPPAGKKGRRRRESVLLPVGGILVLFLVFLLAQRLSWLPRGPSVAPPSSSGSTFPVAASSVPAPGAVSAPGDGPILLDDVVPFDITKRTNNPPFDNKDAFIRWMVAHTDQQAGFLEQRWDLAVLLTQWGDFLHRRVREAFLRTPREYFCRNPRRAYANAALPIGYGQTISGPDLVSHMTDYLDPQPNQKVLEIGTGSGYQAAVLSELSNHVYTVEIIEKLARETDAIFKRLQPLYPEYGNILRKVDDGYYGWQEYAPFDKIIVTCGIDHVPPPLIQQLAPGGTMVIPIGPPSAQSVLRIVKKVAADGIVTLSREDIYHGKIKVRFVPLTGWGGGAHESQ